MSRNWVPCRRCGKDHTNPASSSCCAPCNVLYRAEKAEREAWEQEKERERMIRALFTKDVLEQLLGVLMDDDSLCTDTKESIGYLLDNYDPEL